MPAARFPVGPRALAGALALFAGLYFGAALPGQLLADGYELTAYVLLATAIPLVAFLAGIALFPHGMQRVLARFTKLDLHDGGHVAAATVMGATIFFVLGYGSLVNGAFAYESDARGESEPIGGDALFAGIVLNLVVLVLPPIFYIAFVHGGGPGRAMRALGLRSDGAPRAIFLGAMSALGAIVALAVLAYAFQGLAVEVPENERALEIARSVTVLGAFGLAIGAAVSEEVFFRGFLQPRLGLLGQAVFFALAHLSYLHVLEVVVTFALALIFGVIYRMTGNLLAPIAGHFLFNLIMLMAGIYGPEAA